MNIPPETLAWLRQSAALDGAVVSQVLLNLLERVEALEQRSIPGTVELAASAPEPASPPTLAEAREAARQLAGPCAEVVHAFLSTLKDDPSVGRSLR